MKSSNKKLNITKDLFPWIAVVCTFLAAFYLTYHYTISGAIESIVWIIWFVLTLVFVYLTSLGKLLYKFAQDSKNELLKVVWPTRQETIQTTTIVIVMVTLTGFILWGIDSSMMWTIAKITHLG